MNIDISNAHCGFRTLSVTHAWPRVARTSNPSGRAERRARTPVDARGRGTGAIPGHRRRRLKSLRFERNACGTRRRRGPERASPTKRDGFKLPSARIVVSSRAPERAAVAVSVPAVTSPSRDRTMSASPQRVRAAVGARSHGVPALRFARPTRTPRRQARANHTRDLGSGETTRRI